MLAESHVLGGELLRAWGIDPTGDHITRIEIIIDTGENDGVPFIRITHDMSEAESSDLAEALRQYRLEIPDT